MAHIRLEPDSETPLYRQLASRIEAHIRDGVLRTGERLPPTRELAGQLGLNRTTVSAAYSMLEEAGLIEGQVGRGSFVSGSAAVGSAGSTSAQISFAASRPSGIDFPMQAFRRLATEVIESDQAREILQLGSAHGYGPLRRYLLDQAIAFGIARPSDGLIVTNGCQQGLDLIARLFGSGTGVVLEDPVYHGAHRVFSSAAADIIPVSMDGSGMDVDALEPVLQRKAPKLVVVTPSFQNPTGATLTLERRKRIVALAQQYGCVLVENDIYTELRYTGDPLPTLKELDETGNTILLRSYSKVSFPGLRVGWVIAPRAVIARLAEAKEICDLHSDQLSQAVLLRFAESGELARHLEKTRRAGAERLTTLLRAFAAFLPVGTEWTRPEGGMNVWVELPAPLEADRVLRRAQEAGLTFTPGRLFSVRPLYGRALRISFGGLSTDEITRGVEILGEVTRQELALAKGENDFEPAAALV